MQKIYYLDSKILSTSPSCDFTKEKDDYSLLVLSDSHGDSNVLKAILEHFQNNIDGLFFCGDGTNDLFYALNSVSTLPKFISIVQGNGDSNLVSTSYYNNLSFQTEHNMLCIPDHTVVNLGAYTIFHTHGHKQNVYYGYNSLIAQTKKFQCNVAFYGHTHIANYEFSNEIILMNPGSCSLPRGCLSPSFAIINIRNNPQQFITCTHFEIIKKETYSFLPLKI